MAREISTGQQPAEALSDTELFSNSPIPEAPGLRLSSTTSHRRTEAVLLLALFLIAQAISMARRTPGGTSRTAPVLDAAQSTNCLQAREAHGRSRLCTGLIQRMVRRPKAS